MSEEAMIGMIALGLWSAFVLWRLLRDPTWDKERKERRPRRR